MDFVTLLLGTLGAIVIALLVEQSKASTPHVADWIARKAALRLPEELRPEVEEEWLAVVVNMPGPLLKLVTAFGFHFAVGKLASDFSSEQQRSTANGESSEQQETESETKVQVEGVVLGDASLRATARVVVRHRRARISLSSKLLCDQLNLFDDVDKFVNVRSYIDILKRHRDKGE